jgi:predicted outer membrane protein
MKALLTAAVVLILPVGIARAQTMGNPPSTMENPSIMPSVPNNSTGTNGTANTGPSTNTDTVPVPSTNPSTNPYGTLGSPTQIGSERTTGDDTPTEYGMSKDRVINKLHHVNQMEIRMGTLAQKNAHSSKVKSYGATLVKDHTKADKLVTAFAKDNQIAFTDSSMETETDTARSEEHAAKMQAKKEKMDRLTNLKGDAFDKEFLTTMAEDHQHVINILEATKGRDADKKLDQLIDKLLPTLRDHQRTAERLSQQVPSSS